LNYLLIHEPSSGTLQDVRNSLLLEGNNSALGIVDLGKALQETTPLAMLFVTLLTFIFLFSIILLFNLNSVVLLLLKLVDEFLFLFSLKMKNVLDTL
jgi:hypothetical protein